MLHCNLPRSLLAVAGILAALALGLFFAGNGHAADGPETGPVLSTAPAMRAGAATPSPVSSSAGPGLGSLRLAGFEIYLPVTIRGKSTVPQTAPAAPSGCGVRNLTPSSLDFFWTDNSNNEQYFSVAIFQPPGDFRPLAVVPENRVSLSIVDLPPGSQLMLRVMAVNAAGSSAVCETPWIRMPAASQSLARFVNHASYPIVSLKIDEVELFTASPMGILPDSSYDVDLSPGDHDYLLTTGFWSDSQNRFLMYSYWDSFTVVGGSTTQIVIEDISIQNLLTQFKTSGYWEGEYWTPSGVCYTAAFKFYQDGSWEFFTSNVWRGSGQYALVDRLPDIYSVKFKVAEGADQEGLLVEPYGYFTMKNGPSSWEQITYRYKEGGYVYNPFCP